MPVTLHFMPWTQMGSQCLKSPKALDPFQVLCNGQDDHLSMALTARFLMHTAFVQVGRSEAGHRTKRLTLSRRKLPSKGRRVCKVPGVAQAHWGLLVPPASGLPCAPWQEIRNLEWLLKRG